VLITPVTDVTTLCIYARSMALGRIVAMGGGGFSTERDASPLDDYVLALTGKDRPRSSTRSRRGAADRADCRGLPRAR
jgi:hypothetical protein